MYVHLSLVCLTQQIFVKQRSTGTIVSPNVTTGFLTIPPQFNVSQKKDLLGREEVYVITLHPSHEHFSFKIRACEGKCSNADFAKCLMPSQVGDTRTTCQGNGACLMGEKTHCNCDHIDWQIQMDELSSSLKWIAQFLGKANGLFNSVLWNDPCVPRPSATKVIENLKLSLVIFITVVLATIILLLACIVGICCCCCRGKCGKKKDQQYSSLLQDDDLYDLNTAVDNYDKH